MSRITIKRKPTTKEASSTLDSALSSPPKEASTAEPVKKEKRRIRPIVSRGPSASKVAKSVSTERLASNIRLAVKGAGTIKTMMPHIVVEDAPKPKPRARRLSSILLGGNGPSFLMSPIRGSPAPAPRLPRDTPNPLANEGMHRDVHGFAVAEARARTIKAESTPRRVFASLTMDGGGGESAEDEDDVGNDAVEMDEEAVKEFALFGDWANTPVIPPSASLQPEREEVSGERSVLEESIASVLGGEGEGQEDVEEGKSQTEKDSLAEIDMEEMSKSIMETSISLDEETEVISEGRVSPSIATAPRRSTRKVSSESK